MIPYFNSLSQISIDITDWMADHSRELVLVVLVLLLLLLLLVGIRLLRASTNPPSPQKIPRRSSSHQTSSVVIEPTQPSRWQLVDLTGKSIPLQPLPFFIGREKGSHLLLEDPEIALRHASIDYDSGWGSLIIQDLDSPSGICVDGKPTHKNLLQPEAHLSLGRFTYTIKPVQKA